MKWSINVPPHLLFKYNYKVLGPLNNDEWIVFHPYSLKFLILDKCEAEILSLYKHGYSCTQISNATSASLNYIREVIRNFLNYLENLTPATFFLHDNKSLTIHLSGECNLRCLYCYAKYGSYGENSMPRYVDLEDTKKFFSLVYENYGCSIDQINLFGGEPLLNMRVIEKLADEARLIFGDKVSICMSTNGTILDDSVISVIRSQDIKVTVSLDGPAVIHNLNRQLVFTLTAAKNDKGKKHKHQTRNSKKNGTATRCFKWTS